jgi:hypothetical protein
MAMRHDDLDAPLAQLNAYDQLCARDLAAHVIVTGASGSGKTTGAGALLAGSCLKAGMGMLVCCLKPDEAELWVGRCQRYNRLGSLIRWDGRNHRFNFIAHCLARFGADAISSVIEYLMTILEVVKQAGASPGRASDQFWTDSMRAMLRHTVPLVYAATGTVRIADVLNFVQSAPLTPEQMKDGDWLRSSFFCRICLGAAGKIEDEIGQRCGVYWRDSFASLDPKTRGNILITLTTALDRFNHGWLREAFTTDSTITPELCWHGAVIVMDMPPTTLGEDGLVAQLLFKHCWQQAMLARNAQPPEHQRRFCALFADECQAFVQRGDADFLATCRSSRVCVVYLTQSLPTLYAKIGGDNPQHAAHHLLGNFSTKIWHANSCPETNEWAAKIIGRRVHRRGSYNQGEGATSNYGLGMGEGENWGANSSFGSNSSHSSNGSSSSGSNSSAGSSRGGNDSRNRNRGSGTSENTSWGYSEQMDHIIEPATFGSGLRTGGSAHGGRVTAIWYQAGRVFSTTGANHFVAEFQQ